MVARLAFLAQNLGGSGVPRKRLQGRRSSSSRTALHGVTLFCLYLLLYPERAFNSRCYPSFDTYSLSKAEAFS